MRVSEAISAAPHGLTRYKPSPAALSLCVLGGYWLVLIYQLGAQWSIYEQYNYGWAVPIMCLYLLWRRWQDCPERQAPTRARQAILPLVLVLLFLLPIRVLHEANPVWRVTSLAWSLIVIAVTLCSVWLAGGNRWLGHFGFGIGFFLVAVPWPWPVEVFFTERLTGLNVAATIELVGLTGIPAVQHANVIEVGTGMVGVDQACSGIRSFQATLMIALFFGELYRRSTFRRVGLCVAGFVLSFLFNVVRTTVLTLVAAHKGTAAVANWHDQAGVTILLGCFICLWLIALRLRKGGPESNVQSPKSDSTTSQLYNSVTPSPARLSTIRYPLSMAFALIIWLVCIEVGNELWYRVHEQSGREKLNWSVGPPAENPAFKAVEISTLALREFRADESSQWQWQDASGTHWQVYYFRWLPSSRLNRRVAAQRAKMHGPATCLPLIGMNLKSDLGTKIIALGDFRLAMQQYEFDVEGQAVHVFFGTYEDQTGSEVLANRRIGQSSRVAAAMSGSRNYGQRFLEVAVTGLADPQEAKAALQRELEKLIQRTEDRRQKTEDRRQRIGR